VDEGRLNEKNTWEGGEGGKFLRTGGEGLLSTTPPRGFFRWGGWRTPWSTPKGGISLREKRMPCQRRGGSLVTGKVVTVLWAHTWPRGREGKGLPVVIDLCGEGV